MGGVVDAHEARRLRDRQRAVVDAEPPERVERDAQQVAEINADHAAVRDDQDVVGALETPHPVPFRFTVPCQQESHGRAVVAIQAWAARRRASASSRLRTARTSKSGGDAVPPVSARRVSWARSTSLSPSSSPSSRYRLSSASGVTLGSVSSRRLIAASRAAPASVKYIFAASGA